MILCWTSICLWLLLSLISGDAEPAHCLRHLVQAPCPISIPILMTSLGVISGPSIPCSSTSRLPYNISPFIGLLQLVFHSVNSLQQISQKPFQWQLCLVTVFQFITDCVIHVIVSWVSQMDLLHVDLFHHLWPLSALPSLGGEIIHHMLVELLHYFH